MLSLVRKTVETAEVERWDHITPLRQKTLNSKENGKSNGGPRGATGGHGGQRTNHRPPDFGSGGAPT